MNPLAAFQVLVLAMAAAMAVEAFKPSYSKEWRIGFWVLFGILAIAGIATNQIAAAWPAASSFMAWAVSSPVTIFLAFIAWIIMLQRPWRRSPSASYDDTALRAEIADVSKFAEVLGEAVSKETSAKIEQVGGKLDLTIELFGERLEKLEKGAKEAIKSDEGTSSRIDAVIAAMDRTRAYSEGLAVSIRDLIEGQAEARHEQREAAAQALAEQRQFQAKMEAWVGNLQKKIRLGLAGVDKGFAAIIDRENLLEMAANLQDVGDELTAPSRGEPLGDWETWQAKFALWHKAVEAWARLAAKHRVGVVERVFDTPRSEYKQKWGVEDYGIIGDHDAVHDYKTLCILSRNFHVERKAVDQCLLLAAFAKPSMKVKFDPEDPDDADLLSTEPPPEV